MIRAEGLAPPCGGSRVGILGARERAVLLQSTWRVGGMRA